MKPITQIKIRRSVSTTHIDRYGTNDVVQLDDLRKPELDYPELDGNTIARQLCLPPLSQTFFRSENPFITGVHLQL